MKCPAMNKSKCARNRKSMRAVRNCPKFKCQRPFPKTGNGFLNFLRSFRRKNCGLSPIEMIRKFGAAWNELPESYKDRYRRQMISDTY
ncbi:uncharacterized protein LOC116805310 isoform X2 [Drosophila grimshawi]|uniref:uncharacterized protein LOC116805310 isoform X2 n=1 Tax=Drosophila grimshawi TaxID=7222 RepID=UPI000C870D21|nr:uncharacterized protein LOC116805310 isoform X2 [Drosophila grimshawi]